MDLDNIECVSIPDDEIRNSNNNNNNNNNPSSRLYHHGFLQQPKPQPQSQQPHTNSVGVGSNVIPPAATSVHELLECPVCTNSMYPPIHQVYA